LGWFSKIDQKGVFVLDWFRERIHFEETVESNAHTNS
jgi:hypothetical protein